MPLAELDSAERVVSEPVAQVRSVALGFWIGVGSREERDDVSHFIERLLFTGPTAYAEQIARSSM